MAEYWKYIDPQLVFLIVSLVNKVSNTVIPTVLDAEWGKNSTNCHKWKYTVFQRYLHKKIKISKDLSFYILKF